MKPRFHLSLFPLSGSCIWLILEEVIRYKGDFRTASIYHRTTLDAEESAMFRRL